MADFRPDMIYFDERGYEKHLYSIENVYLDDLDKFPALVDEPRASNEEADEELAYVYRNVRDAIYYYEVTSDSPSFLLKEKTATVRKVVYKNLGIPKDLRTTNYNSRAFLAAKKIRSRLLVVGYVEARPVTSGSWRMFDEELTWQDIAFAHIHFSGKRFVQSFFLKQMDPEKDADKRSTPAENAEREN
ncbi:unnamed protein product [Bemisia tabaci]|uniref:Uncharacterized protein n=1 Tax=Bemisia tabaci TaxID=7038 RepID=A0A9P0CD43_BEMTA|nr:PREDICTED: uncharacterized protein LOC109039989 isoform X2 [Bemisia tabaci]CAH0766278.1 unnamed protein product [Bemisia tabaci]